jgi:putative endonuclease
VLDHKSGTGSEFTRKYNITRLVYAEEAPDAITAISREKQIKRWRREKKLRLIKTTNADWRDLAEEYGIVGEDPA